MLVSLTRRGSVVTKLYQITFLVECFTRTTRLGRSIHYIAINLKGPILIAHPFADCIAKTRQTPKGIQMNGSCERLAWGVGQFVRR